MVGIIGIGRSPDLLASFIGLIAQFLKGLLPPLCLFLFSSNRPSKFVQPCIGFVSRGTHGWSLSWCEAHLMET